jgi:hypothetical protein
MSHEESGQTTRAAGTAKTVQAGLLSWILPGAGHWMLGHRGLAVVFFVAISLPFWVGLAIGGIRLRSIRGVTRGCSWPRWHRGLHEPVADFE